MVVRAVGEMPMQAKMVQGFLREVTGEIDVDGVVFGRLQPGVLMVHTPDGDRKLVKVMSMEERGLL